MLSPNKKNQGYVAVVSSIIITAIVIVIALVFSSSNYLGRFDNQGVEMKDISREVAEGCLEYAKLKIAEGQYNGGELKTIGDYSCYILPIETFAEGYIIKATSTVHNRETKLRLKISSSNLETISLEEVTSF